MKNKDKRMEKTLQKAKEMLSEEEWQRISEQRKFQKIEPGTWTYKIALFLDPLRQQYLAEKSQIEKRLWQISSLHDGIIRCEKQLEVGVVDEPLDDKRTMTIQELKTHIQHREWLKEGEVKGIAKSLGTIRSIVGHYDYVKNVIMTEEEFNKYVEDVNKKLQGFGHELLEE